MQEVEDEVQRLSPRGLSVRLAVAGVVLALLAVTSLFGSDDHFPFAPFRMYATYHAPDGAAEDTLLVGVNTKGRRVALWERTVGVRRAEIEGQKPALVAEPERLAQFADNYARLHPGRPPLVRVELLTRWHTIRDSRPTGESYVEVEATWNR